MPGRTSCPNLPTRRLRRAAAHLSKSVHPSGDWGRFCNAESLVTLGVVPQNQTFAVQDHMANPYESPTTLDTSRQRKSNPFLTRQRVFWMGLGSIVFALMLATGSQVLFVGSRRWAGPWGILVVAVDGIAAFMFFGGIVAFVVYHWFPDPMRKYSWRRKRSDKQ